MARASRVLVFSLFFGRVGVRDKTIRSLTSEIVQNEGCDEPAGAILSAQADKPKQS